MQDRHGGFLVTSLAIHKRFTFSVWFLRRLLTSLPS